MNTTPTINCEFLICVEPKYAAYGIKGYSLGKKNFRKFESFTNAINTAFGKDLGTGRFLQVTVEYTAPDGTRQGVLTKSNYVEGLTIIEEELTAELITLDDLLES